MVVHKLIRESITLRDGRRVMLRPVRSSDAPRLIELHSRLSGESQYMRFFGTKPILTEEEAAYLAGVDHERRFAIAATVREEGTERVIGVGRFDLSEGLAAEAAVVVRDDYQGAGLGTAILERMIEVARGRGVRAFRGEILSENDRMLGLLRSNGYDVGARDRSVVDVVVPLEPVPSVLAILRIIAPFTGSLVQRAVRIVRGQSS